MSDEPRCPFCSGVITSVTEREGWWTVPCGHAISRRQFAELRDVFTARPWCFDVPEVPDHVTALSGRFTNHRLWLRVEAPTGFQRWHRGSWWACQLSDGSLSPTVHITDIAPYAPLVEAVDPRAAS